jgi:hypothetical protein
MFARGQFNGPDKTVRLGSTIASEGYWPGLVQTRSTVANKAGRYTVERVYSVVSGRKAANVKSTGQVTVGRIRPLK